MCTGLTYRFGDHVAVDHVNLKIEPGETFGLLGPNGAGKTTTIRMLTTLLKPAEGRVTVFGTDAASQPMRVRRMIGPDASLDDVFRHFTGGTLDSGTAKGGIRDVRRARRTARRLG